MDWNWKMRFDVEGVKLSYHAEQGTKLAVVTVKRLVDEAKAKQLFGASFASRLFGAAGETDDDGYHHEWAGGIVPKSVMSSHKVRLIRSTEEDAVKASCVPKVRKLTPEDGRAECVLTVDLPIVFKDSKTAGALAMLVGEEVEVDFEAAQLSLIGDQAQPTGKKNFGHPVIGSGAPATA